ncbi:MAG: YegS/Rv2252/BmrU family lipid kinase [Gemmatimonadetes bacterium]|nr:YegS/Rv2252/BmrU family lipid kinase [Gemmatimonadota bacterium]NIO32573.1 YegS/Rv2252/BmrU family lipid kinase [Gemmatimonadota bacterium]
MDGSATGGLFVIHNPAAGPTQAERLQRRVETALSQRQVPYEYARTEAPGHARELAAAALASGYGRVLVAGGDGTVLEAVSVLVDRESALALLPVGTGNQLAANLGVPTRMGAALDVALAGQVREIDVGMMDEQPFTIIAGAGFDAEVVRPRSEIKKRLGYLAYLHAATAAAFAPRPSTLRIIVDGEEHVIDGIGVEVANMPGLTAPLLRRPVDLVPDGRPDDGLLDVCVLAVTTTADFLSAMGSIIARRYRRNPRLRYFRGREVMVEADPPLPVQIDGERLERTTPFASYIRPRALRVLVPVE